MADQPIEDDQGALERRIARGAQALPGLPASDDVRMGTVLAGVPSALGVTFVSPLFTALATWPDWLDDAWARASVSIGNAEWRAATDAVRAAAHRSASAGEVGAVLPAETAAYLRLLDRLLPGLLVLACAWGDADGSPALTVEPGSPPAVDPSTPPSGRIDAATERALADLAAAHGHPRVLSVYRSIAGGGPLFAAEAPALLARAVDPAYDSLRAGLRDAARTERLATGIPAAPDGAADILALFGARLIPDLVLDTTWLRVRAGLEGAP